MEQGLLIGMPDFKLENVVCLQFAMSGGWVAVFSWPSMECDGFVFL